MSTTRMTRYVPIAQKFSARLGLFHDAIALNAGLHLTDVKVLRLLGDASMTPSQLIEQTGLTGAAITAVVDRLVAAGYATRERDEADRRRVTITAVPAKIRKLDRLYSDYGADIAKLLAQYDAVEFAAIESFLVATTELLAEHAAKLRERADGISAKE
jgi:DNA-binding MarR family transcriptional regulator